MYKVDRVNARFLKNKARKNNVEFIIEDNDDIGWIDAVGIDTVSILTVCYENFIDLEKLDLTGVRVLNISNATWRNIDALPKVAPDLKRLIVHKDGEVPDTIRTHCDVIGIAQYVFKYPKALRGSVIDALSNEDFWLEESVFAHSLYGIDNDHIILEAISTLWLWETDMTEVSFISRLPNLQMLAICDNPAPFDCSYIGPSVEYLYLSNASLKSEEALLTLPHLHQVDVELSYFNKHRKFLNRLNGQGVIIFRDDENFDDLADYLDSIVNRDTNNSGLENELRWSVDYYEPNLTSSDLYTGV